MKNWIILTLVVVSACSGSSQNENQSEGEGEVSLEGKFTIENASLSIVSAETSLQEAIDFQIDITGGESQMTVFNSAIMEDFDDNSVTFVFKDVPISKGGNGLQDLVFTFSYVDNVWEVKDLVAMSGQDSTRQFDLSGTYKRAEE